MRALLLLFCLAAVACGPRHECVRSHIETVHWPAYVTYLQVGDVSMPIWHDAHDNDVTRCDQWREVRKELPRP